MGQKKSSYRGDFTPLTTGDLLCPPTAPAGFRVLVRSKSNPGPRYFVNSDDGISSWQDPRIDAQWPRTELENFFDTTVGGGWRWPFQIYAPEKKHNIAPANWPSQKETIVFQKSIFRCELLVSGIAFSFWKGTCFFFYGLGSHGHWMKISIKGPTIWEKNGTLGGKLVFFLKLTWNPNDPCFDWKRPCFGGLTFKNRGHLGSRNFYGSVFGWFFLLAFFYFFQNDESL